MRWWPRSIRWQMFLGLALLEALSIALFATVLVRLQQQESHRRAADRLSHQADSLSGQVQLALLQKREDWVPVSVRIMGRAPSVDRARLTDPAGNVLADSGEPPAPLTPAERIQTPRLRGRSARVFSLEDNQWEAVEPIYDGSVLYGYAWILSDRAWDTAEVSGIIRSTALFGLIWVIASLLLVWVLSRSISRPLAVLHRGTRELVSLPESSGSFPLPVPVKNEIGDLIEAFNRMVAAIEEQRSGLHDALSLLDSMLANAPVGFAFFDRYGRIVRVNQVFADLHGHPVSRHLGRTPAEIFPAKVAAQYDHGLQAVFSTGEPVNDLEFRGEGPSGPWTWLVSAYPVRTSPTQVRWAGVIIRDVSERVRAEEALRKTEKLAATGRLAASIAHEINNPLEALTNLLYLLRNFTGITGTALDYVRMAEHETRRISEIAQQTLRFYRQSTLPVRACVAELINPILDLYKSRTNTLNIEIERDFDAETTLFCYEGEIRQVLANLIGNAIDATAGGGRLVVRARNSRHWSDSQISGVRITIADTGIGMTPDVRNRIFEAFFTTKEDVGTGLGLWVSHEIIQKHRGVIHVRSRAGVRGQPSGTAFQLFLPDDETLAARARPTPE